MRTAILSIFTVLLVSPIAVFANNYTDIPEDAWYKDTVEQFVENGYLSATEELFRGGEMATRAEFIKLIVELNGGILATPPAVSSFSDVPTGAWYYGYFEDAAVEGWVRGDGDCYGSKPCYARPDSGISRAEAASLIVRSFALLPTGQSAQFVDNPEEEWYAESIQTAADHCVLTGDDAAGTVRPSDNMNRAEMVVMLERADLEMKYGTDCSS